MAHKGYITKHILHILFIIWSIVGLFTSIGFGITGHAYSVSEAPSSFHELPTADGMDTLKTREDGLLQANWIIYRENEDGTLQVTGYDRSFHDSLYDPEKDALRYANNPELTIDHTYESYDGDKHLYSLYIFNTVDGRKVTSIAPGAFENQLFHGVYIDSGITIGEGAFRNMEIKLPTRTPASAGYSICIGTPKVNEKGEILLDENDFVNAININDSEIVDAVTNTVTIGYSAFEGCNIECPVAFCCDCILNSGCFKKLHSYYSIDMADDSSITGSIGTSAMEECTARPFTDPIHLNVDKVTTISNYAFYNCGIRTLTLPASITSTGKDCFEVITIDNGAYGVYDTLDLFLQDENMDISVLHLEDSEKTVLHVNPDSPAGEYCSNHNITWSNESSSTVIHKIPPDGTTFTISGNTYSIWGEGTVALRQLRTYSKSISIGNLNPISYLGHTFPISTLGSNSIDGTNCPELKSLILNDTIKTIETNAIAADTPLEKLVLSSGVETISEFAIPDRDGLIVEIPDSLTNIPNFNIGELHNVIFNVSSDNPIIRILVNNNLIIQYPDGTTLTPDNSDYPDGKTDSSSDNSDNSNTPDYPPSGGENDVVTPPDSGNDEVVNPPSNDNDDVVNPPSSGNDDVVNPPSNDNNDVLNPYDNGKEDITNPSDSGNDNVVNPPSNNNIDNINYSSADNKSNTRQPDSNKNTVETTISDNGNTSKPSSNAIIDNSKSNINNNSQRNRTNTANNYIVGKACYKITGKSSVTFICTKKTTYKKLDIPNTVKINKKTYKVTKIAAGACSTNKNLTTVKIGNNVTGIGNRAFAKCTKLKTIVFGKKVVTIGKKVLYNDKKLEKITFRGTKVKSIGSKTFKNVPHSVNILVPNSKVTTYSNLINTASR